MANRDCLSILLFVCHFDQGRRSVLKDCCAIADNTVLPPETVVPPFTVFSGSPGRLPVCHPCSFFLLVFFSFFFLLGVCVGRGGGCSGGHAMR